VAAGNAYLCVTIDCECDKGPGWRTQKPLSFMGVRVGVLERIHPLFQSMGAKPTYLLSPELLRDAECVERLDALGACELGTHLHGEMAEPGAFEPDETTFVQRDYPEAIERAKLTWLTDTYRAAFGRTPSSFRAGRFGIGPNTVPILESLGYAVDSSVTPHMDWSHVSPGLVFDKAPTQPYRPDARRPDIAGSSRLLEVPVTIRPRTLSRVPVIGKHVEPRWLRPTKASGAALIALARETIDDERRRRPGKPVVLNAMFHNVEIVPGTSPYAKTDAEALQILGHLATLLEATRGDGIQCVGLSDLPELIA
jgi:hypothetical protein